MYYGKNETPGSGTHRQERDSSGRPFGLSRRIEVRGSRLVIQMSSIC